MRWPATYVPLVEPLSTTCMRSSITVACEPLTAGCARTERRARRLAPDDDVPARCRRLAGAMSIIAMAGCASGTGVWPTAKLRSEVEGDERVRRNGRAVRERRGGPGVDEVDGPLLLHDARVERRDTGPLQDDVAIGGASEGDDFLAETNHGFFLATVAVRARTTTLVDAPTCLRGRFVFGISSSPTEALTAPAA